MSWIKPQLLGVSKFAGNFNLCFMSDLIEDGYCPEKPFPSYEDVYNAIMNYDPEVTAKCRLGVPVPLSDSDGNDLSCGDSNKDEVDSEGRFRGRDSHPSGPGMTARVTRSRDVSNLCEFE
jgi:hypothetical protein